MNFSVMLFGAGWGVGVFSHDFATERILHVDHEPFHWSDGKVLGPIIGFVIFLIGMAL